MGADNTFGETNFNPNKIMDIIKHRFFKDEYGFLLCTSADWMKLPDHGKPNAVGSTGRAAITYEEKDFLDAFQSCFEIRDGKWYGERHPDVDTDLSRDNVLNWTIGLFYINPDALWMTLKVPWRISDKFVQRDLWLLIRAIVKKTWFWTFLYWIVGSIFFRIGRICLQLGLLIGNFKTVHYTKYKALDKLTWNQTIGKKIMKIMPSYTVHQTCWALTCLKPSWFQRSLQKVLLDMVEPSNYLCRILLADKLSEEDLIEIDAYSGMDRYRWSGRLDGSSTWEKYPIEGEQPPYNLDKDILQAVIKLTNQQ